MIDRFIKYFIVLALCLCAANLASAQPLCYVEHDAYVSYYDLSTNNPALVVWELKYKDFQGVLKPTSRHFRSDTQLPPPRVKDKHLKGTGYVRGHLCPAADRDSDKGLLKQTFFTSNMSPMTMVCNSGAMKIVEDTIRYLAKTHFTQVTCAGTIFADSLLGAPEINGVAVPVAFFRLTRCKKHPEEIYAWVIQNSQTSSRPCRCTVDVLQQVLQDRPSVLAALRQNGFID